MAVSLTDQYVLLLENVVKENRELREQIRAGNQQDRAALTEITNKVQELSGKVDLCVASGSARRPVRQTGGTVRVPKMCSNDVRRMIKAMASSDNTGMTLKVDQSQDSEHNIAVFQKLKTELLHEYGGEEKCPWTLLQMKAAYKTYFKTLKASNIRKAKKKDKEHVQACRRQNRKREKLGRRLKSVTMKKLSDEKKARVADVMRTDYMSSEESDIDEEPPHKTLRYVVKPLMWESQELKKVKKSLDKCHMSSLPELVRRRVLERQIGPPSLRQKPHQCPDWASIC